MWNFLKKTSLYILAIPVLFTFLGVTSNQAVLIANHDKFPVMYNDYKINAYKLSLEKDLKACYDSTAPDLCDPIEFDLAALKFGYLDDTHVIMTSKTHLNFLADNVGFYYGQCAEICGRYHHHMPIRLCVLPYEQFLV